MTHNITAERVRELYEASRRPVKYDFVRRIREECESLTVDEANDLFELLKADKEGLMMEILRIGGS